MTMPSASDTRNDKLVPGARERLLRSRTEIIRLLSAVSEAGDPIVTEIDDGELLFVSHILCLDSDNDVFTTTWSPSKPANRLVLEQTQLKFHCNHGGARLEFIGTHPGEVEHDGRPALGLKLPKALLVLQPLPAEEVARTGHSTEWPMTSPDDTAEFPSSHQQAPSSFAAIVASAASASTHKKSPWIHLRADRTPPPSSHCAVAVGSVSATRRAIPGSLYEPFWGSLL